MILIVGAIGAASIATALAGLMPSEDVCIGAYGEEVYEVTRTTAPDMFQDIARYVKEQSEEDHCQRIVMADVCSEESGSSISQYYPRQESGLHHCRDPTC